jgi:phage gp29-like protein
MAPPRRTSSATRTLTSGQVVTRIDTQEFAWLGQLLPNPDPILRAAGRQISTYREISRDSHVGACIRRRKSAVKSLEWGVDRGQAPARVASAITDMLGALDLDAAIGHMLEACQYGYAPMEINWAATSRGVMAAELVALPPEWFCFDTDGALRFKSRTAPVAGELLPDRKFLLPRQDATYANPYGQGDLSLCYWPAVFMRGSKRFWLTFCEKWGSAFAVGKLPRGVAPGERDQLLDELEKLVQNGVAVIPDDGSVDIKEAAGKGASADLYERLVLHCRGEISIVQTGTNQTVEASANKASAHAGMDVASDLRDADAEIVASAVNQLIRWAVEINWPGAAAPTFSLWDQEAKDQLQASRDASNQKAGARFTKAYWMRSYGYQDTDLVDDTTPPVPPGGSIGSALPADAVAFAQGVLSAAAEAPADPTAAEQAALTSAAEPAWGDLADQVAALVSAAQTPDELRVALLAAYGQLDQDRLVKLMAAAFALADLKGMADAQADAVGGQGA